MKKNVLVTGSGQSNFLLQLYGNISPKTPQLNFNSINLKNFGEPNIKKEAENVFQKNYQYKFVFDKFYRIFQALVKIITTNYFWKDQRILFAEVGRDYFKNCFFLTKKHISAYHYAKFIDHSTETDIIHLHYPNHSFNLFLIYLNKEYRLIQTFWGSDIFRIKNWKDHEIHKKTLPISNIITISTPEMKFAVLNRYGFEISEKIRNVKFIHNNTYYQLADKFSKDQGWQSEFKSTWMIPNDKILLMFGHNANSKNNHLKFIEVLNQIPAEILSRIHIIFPLTYGNPKKDHISLIKEKTSKINTTFTYIEEFMDWEILAKVKLLSDVYIHCPTTDALSGYLTEYFYTNNIAIVGGWLPYKTFTDIGLKYLEFDDFDKLKDILIVLPKHIEFFKQINCINKQIVAENFSVDKISDKWADIFNELID